MRILFLNPPFGYRRPEGLDAPLGIMYLGAVLKGIGHECALVDHAWASDNDWRKWDAALAEKPDCILINTQIRFTNTTQEAVRRAVTIHPGGLRIAFGPQASTESNRLLELGFDASILGEPEEVVPSLLKEVSSATDGAFTRSLPEMSGIATKANPMVSYAPRVDPEKLPYPDWSLVDYRRYIATTGNAVIMASRGFDRTDAFNQPPLIYATEPTRRCSVPRVISELRALRRKFAGTYVVLFHDEVFTEDRQWVISLCNELRSEKLGVPFWAFTRPDCVDPFLCLTLRKAGFVGISMGMESGADRVLRLLNRQLTIEQITAGFRSAQKAGLLTVGSIMLGTPGTSAEQDETAEEIDATIEMVRKLHPDNLTVTITTPLPGTSLYERGAERLLIAQPVDFNYYDCRRKKYPVCLTTLNAEQLWEKVLTVRNAWKKGALISMFRLLQSIGYNPAYGSTMAASSFRVLKQKFFK